MKKNRLSAAIASSLIAAATESQPAQTRDIAEPLSDAELEQRIEDLKPTAPRITKEHIQSLIVDETYTNLEGTRTTVCRLQLANGFCVVGVNNGPVSAANFDQAHGCEYAYKAAVDQIWPLEGYLLAERLFRAAVEDEKVGKLRDLVEIQTSPGNADQGEYMRGMANGLIVALSVFTGQEPTFVDAPALTHQERVIVERAELDARAARLEDFINGETFPGLDPAERLRLLDQHAVMEELSRILAARIAAFKND